MTETNNMSLHVNNKPIDNVEDIILANELLPILEKEANSKGLNVYVFTNEEVNKYFTTKSKYLGMALLAKDEDNALWNLKNLRKCYMIRFTETEN